MTPTVRLLSIDWDYFVPMPSIDDPLWMLYDWGHTDAEKRRRYQSAAWVIRAQDLINANVPLLTTSGEERAFWNHPIIAPHAQVYVSDSHAHAADDDVHYGVTEVWNFDAHHDCGYGQGVLNAYHGEYNCTNWMLRYALLQGEHTCRVIYPSWRASWPVENREVYVPFSFNHFQQAGVQFDRVFICRSGAWTPPWLDQHFTEFLRRVPTTNQPIRLGAERGDPGIEPRFWDMPRVIAKAAEMRELIATLRSTAAESNEEGASLMGYCIATGEIGHVGDAASDGTATSVHPRSLVRGEDAEGSLRRILPRGVRIGVGRPDHAERQRAHYEIGGVARHTPRDAT